MSNTSLLVFKLRLKMKIIRSAAPRRAAGRRWRRNRRRGSWRKRSTCGRIVEVEEERKRQLEYHKRVVAEMKRQEEMRVAAAEAKKIRCATTIQSVCRGFIVRMHLDDYVLKGNEIYTVSKFRNGKRISAAGLNGYEAMASRATKAEKDRLRAQVVAARNFDSSGGTSQRGPASPGRAKVNRTL